MSEVNKTTEPVEEKTKRPGRPKRVPAALDPKGIASREAAHAIKVAEFMGGRS